MSVLLFFAAMLGGALNAVAGGGSFIALPALLYAGVAPVTANATAAVALWPGSVSSAVAYRQNITVPVGTPFIISVAVFWPGVTLNILVAVRNGADATSWMQETPAGEVKRASTRASATGRTFCCEPLQAQASAAAPAVAR